MLVHVSMHVTHVHLRRRAAMLDRPRNPNVGTFAKSHKRYHVGGSLQPPLLLSPVRSWGRDAVARCLQRAAFAC